MRIVDRAAFLALPAGTVFSKYSPCIFGELLIKGDSLPFLYGSGPGDFTYTSIADAVDFSDTFDFLETTQAAEAGKEVAMDFYCYSRDGLYDDEHFAVWSREDVKGLIGRLQQALEFSRAET